jgi:hypothetical protein|tara:strand:- start:7 stop:990 length:984 start_codon:yes stop_codon:yes gene_type:complete
MFKNLELQESSVRPFKAHKNFTFTNNDSGSGVWGIKARSGSLFNYVSASDAVTQVVSGSITTRYFGLPTWHMLNQTFYANHITASYNPGLISRNLNTSASILSVGRDLFGEEIKPGSLDLSVTIGSVTFDIRDDGDGNLYDNAHSASFSTFKTNKFTSGSTTTTNAVGSGSEVGNIMYGQGLLVFTDTGSYADAATSAYTLKYQATHTIYEYEYRVNAKPFEFNTSTNISLTPDRSGSITIAEGAVSMSNFFPPSHNPSGEGTGSYATFYNAATESLSIVTGSEFKPYVTDIGLYSEENELLAHGKLAKPIRLSDDIETTFVVRFDV